MPEIKNMMMSMLVLPLSLGMLSHSAAASDEGSKKRDPNEVVCKRETILGSRLASKKVCMTRSQWAERARLDREAVERAQKSACVPTKGSSC